MDQHLFEKRLLIIIIILHHISYQVWVAAFKKNSRVCTHTLSGWARLRLLCRSVFHDYAKNLTCSLDGPGYFPQRGCVWLHSSPEGHVWAWMTENIHWSRSVECESKRTPCLVYVHHHTGVVSAQSLLTRRHVVAHVVMSAGSFSSRPLYTRIQTWLATGKWKSKSCASRDEAFRNTACKL